MRVERFIDTNIFVYAFTEGDPRCLEAERIVESGGRISVQVLNELVSVLAGKLRRPWPDIRKRLEIVATLMEPPTPLTQVTHAEAVGLAETHAIPIYDALIIAAAHEQGCTQLLTEDMQAGRRFGSLVIVNPFDHDLRQ